MKIIHTADIHFESKFQDLDENKKRIRENEFFNAFKNLVTYAKKENVEVIIISGDLFDKSSVKKSTINTFINILNSNQDIQFLYCLGNHDPKDLFKNFEIKNLKVFKENYFEEFIYKNIYFYGANFDNKYKESLYNSLNTSKNHINIVLLHGDISNYEEDNKININKFKNKYINYLALGHIHHRHFDKLDDEYGYYAYPGNLETRGFDELDSKGFYLIDTNDFSKTKYIPNSIRIAYEINIDISNVLDNNSLINLILDKMKNKSNDYKKNLYKINLIGQHKESVDVNITDLMNNLNDEAFRLKIINKSSLKLDYKDYTNDNSFKGELVRLIEKENLKEEEKNKILEKGFYYISESGKIG